MSLRDQILAIKNDVPSELVEIPEWGVSVLVKGFTLGAKDEFLANVIDVDTKSTDLKKFNSGLLIGTAYDPETGERLFTEADIPALKEKSAAAVNRITDVGAKLSGLAEEAVEAAAKKSSSILSGE